MMEMNIDRNNKGMRRRVRRDFRTKLWKEMRQLAKEYSHLQSLVRNAPTVPLENPYQRGWVRYFKLDTQLHNRMDYPEIEKVLKAVNRIQYCRKGTFLRQKKKGKGMRLREHHLRIPNICDLETYKIPEDLLGYLVLPSGRSLGSYDEFRRMRMEGYRLALRFCFAELCHSVTEPYMITHRRVVLPEIESRLKRLEAKMERERIMEKLYRSQWRGRFRGWGRELRRCH